MWWIWPIYIVLLVAVTWLSVLLARFIDALDKKTKISGGVLGGILLAAVTSLPELITSLSAILLMDEPGMTFGNIMGSNFFDITIIGAIMLVMFMVIRKRKLSKGTGYFILLSFIMSAIILIFNIFNLEIVIPYLNINVLSLIILGAYITILLLSRKKDEEDLGEKEKEVKIKMSVKQIVVWFIICAIALIAVSVGITYATDYIATTYSIGKGIAGALFLGIATSLPEVISSIELVRLGNFDMAVSDIFGSCMFNYLVLTIADIFYFSGSVFVFDLQSIYFASFMLLSTIIFFAVYFLKRKKTKVAQKPWLYILTGTLMVCSYLTCMVLSATL